MALFGACLPSFVGSATIALPALIAAELPACIHLPRVLVDQALATGATIIEKRVYKAPVKFRTKAIAPLFSDGTTYLFAFPSLSARHKAWDGWNAGFRPAGSAPLREIAIYRLP